MLPASAWEHWDGHVTLSSDTRIPRPVDPWTCAPTDETLQALCVGSLKLNRRDVCPTCHEAASPDQRVLISRRLGPACCPIAWGRSRTAALTGRRWVVMCSKRGIWLAEHLCSLAPAVAAFSHGVAPARGALWAQPAYSGQQRADTRPMRCTPPSAPRAQVDATPAASPPALLLVAG
jgi:hypothetical protein